MGTDSSAAPATRVERLSVEGVSDDSSAAARVRSDGLSVTSTSAPARPRAAVVANDRRRLGVGAQGRRTWGAVVVGLSSVESNVTILPFQDSRRGSYHAGG